jgi:hypothetical protein
MWNVGSATTMSQMFMKARRFNGGVSEWDVGKVTNMERMFQFATQFGD